MERLITDIGQYGTMIEQATAALDEPIDSNVAYRDRPRQMYADYQAAWDSQGRDPPAPPREEPSDSNDASRARQRQMYADYQAAWDSQGRDSHRAFLRMI